MMSTILRILCDAGSDADRYTTAGRKLYILLKLNLYVNVDMSDFNNKTVGWKCSTEFCSSSIRNTNDVKSTSKYV